MLEYHLTMMLDQKKKKKKPLALNYLLPDNFPDESPQKALKWSLALFLCITFACTQDLRSCNSSGFYLHRGIVVSRVPDYRRSGHAAFHRLEQQPVSSRVQVLGLLREEGALRSQE